MLYINFNIKNHIGINRKHKLKYHNLKHAANINYLLEHAKMIYIIMSLFSSY